jgi:hypothetical protein
MPVPDLAPDCSRCDALCCILLAFDASDAFADDKPACEACRHLDGNNACRIHADLSGHGFQGCAVYTCYGAGQRITQSLFKGRSWRDDAKVLPAMEDAFRSLRRLHEAAWLLHEAARLPLPPDKERQRLHLISVLDAGRDWTETSLRSAGLAEALKSVQQFLASLRDLPALKPTHR